MRAETFLQGVGRFTVGVVSDGRVQPMVSFDEPGPARPCIPWGWTSSSTSALMGTLQAVEGQRRIRPARFTARRNVRSSEPRRQ